MELAEHGFRISRRLVARRRSAALVLLLAALEALRRLLQHRLIVAKAEAGRLAWAKARTKEGAFKAKDVVTKLEAKVKAKDDALADTARRKLCGAMHDGFEAARKVMPSACGAAVEEDHPLSPGSPGLRLRHRRALSPGTWGSGIEDLVLPVQTRHGKDCQMTFFAAKRFANFRSTLGVVEDAFWSSLCDGDLEGGGIEASGKSGSMFWTTADGFLRMKSITKAELRNLLKSLPSLMQHFVSNRNSLICRFFAAFELRLDRSRHLVVVMNDLFAAQPDPHVVYDLKGTTEDRWVNPRPGVVLKDLNFADKIIGIADERHKVELLHALRKDTKFLRSRNIMDYSVCLGVHYCEDSAHLPPEHTVRVPGILSPISVLKGFEPKFQCTLVRDQAAHRVVYYIGIVDVLQQYDLRKFVAHVLKSMSLGWVHEIDTAFPSYYARRLKTLFLGKVQTFREPGDRVARFARRLQGGIERGTIPRPTFAVTRPATGGSATDSSGDAAAGRAIASLVAVPVRDRARPGIVRPGQGEEVTMDEAINFAVRYGGHLMLRCTGWFRSWHEEVEAYLDMDRHALVFKEMSRSALAKRRPTTAVACYKIRRVYLSIACHRPRDRYCQVCHSPIKIEAESEESRRFTVDADDILLRFTAPSRRQAVLWVTALEVAAAYAEANVEEMKEAAAEVMAASVLVRAAVMGALEAYLQTQDCRRTVCVSRSACLGVLEPFLMGPEAERRWGKRRVKWIFGFVNLDGMDGLTLGKVRALWREMNINTEESEEVLSHFMSEAREGRRADGGRQIGAGWIIHLAGFRRMMQQLDSAYARDVRNFLGHPTASGGTGTSGAAGGAGPGVGAEDTMSAEDLVHFLMQVQHVVPAPSVNQVRRLLQRLLPPLVTRSLGLSAVGLAHLLCSPSNSITDPAKRVVFQDMTQPLASYFIDTSHNTYLEGNQLSSRSSVLRYVEVLRTGCRCIEVDVWDGNEGEPVVKHGYTVTTEVFFEDAMQAIADHAFVASDYPVIISVEQHCSAMQKIRQGEIMSKVLGDSLFMPPWDEQSDCIDYEKMKDVSPWLARGCFLVKSELGCCERCRRPLPAYDRCIALPTRKLQHSEKESFKQGELPQYLQSGPEGRQTCHVCSLAGGKLAKLRHTAGEGTLRSWTSRYLQRVYPEGTMIGSRNIDPMPHWCCGVQMVAMNYQTPDAGLLLNEGLFRTYNGGCGYILKGGPSPRCGSRLKLRICCGHRLPRPEAPLAQGTEASGGGPSAGSSAVSSPFVTVGLEPGGQVAHTRVVACDGYHPVFDHEVNFAVPEAALHILTFEVRDAPSSRTMAWRAVPLDAVREGFRWLPLRTTLGTCMGDPHAHVIET